MNRMASTTIVYIKVLILLQVNRLIITEESPWPVRELRGAFVATVTNIDWPSSSHLTSSQQKEELVHLLDKLHELNFNAIVFQVRPAGDAFYNSSYEPWSSYLTGTQGKAPSPFYDPLEFVVNEAHRRNIEVHAWFNPYRARVGSTSTSGLASNHVAKTHPEFVYHYGTTLWMDPGASVIRDHAIKVFIDVVKRYNIDGVHIDDYFYPYPESGTDFPDSKTYAAYQHSGGTLTLANWRRHNIDSLIQTLSIQIKATKPHVKFGISPFGIWQPGHPHGIIGFNAYTGLYADARKWISEGWLDYLTPQLYWKIDPPAQSYPVLLDWWLDQNTHGHHVYVGNYASAITVHNWPVNELERQVQVSRSRASRNSLGNIHFSAKYFVKNINGISDSFHADLYKTPALPPVMSWLTYPNPPTPLNVKTNGHVVTWDADVSNHVRSWAIYHSSADVYNLVAVLPKSLTSFTTSGNGNYVVVSVNRLGVQSQQTNFTITDTTVVG